MKILVIHPGSLGDVILSLPSLHALRQAYPMARLDGMGNPSIFELLKERFYITDVISIDRADVSSCLTGQSDPASPLPCALREYAFVVNWLGDQDGEFSCPLHRLGVRKIFSSRPISHETAHQHRTQIFLDALAPLGIPNPFTRPRLFPSLEDKRLGQQALAWAGVSLKEQPILAIHPGSGGVLKCWDLSRFIAVSHCVQEQLGFRPLFILGPADQAISQSLKNSWGDDLSILECVPLPVLAGALTWCSGYLGNDSGVTHLAAALDIPTVAIFGPTHPDLWAPIGHGVTILSKRKEGRHVGGGVCQGCDCLGLITVEDVMPALAKIALDYSSVIC